MQRGFVDVFRKIKDIQNFILYFFMPIRYLHLRDTMLSVFDFAQADGD